MKHNYEFDYFVIGGGSGGVRSARIASQHGAKVGLAEGQHLGGTCVNVGCVPKKLFSYASDYGYGFSDSRGYGWQTPDISLNWKTLIDRKNTEILRLNGIYGSLLDTAGVKVFSEFASFIDNHTLQVGDQILTADKILIATGGQPRKLDIDGGEHCLVSDDLFYLEDLPERIAVIGGGYIAVEFAHIYKGLGCKVDVIYHGDLFMRGFDNDIRKALAVELEKQGIRLHFNFKPSKIDKNDAGYTLHSADGRVQNYDMIASAIGRLPAISKLGLENISIEQNKDSSITVDQFNKTNVDNIYAVGDVTNKVNLTPVAIREGHILADNLFSTQEKRCVDYSNIPTAVFSKPEIATCGLTEEQAKEQGIAVDVYKSDFKPMIHRLSGRDECTLMKLIVDKTTTRVIGCHLMGKDAAEMMQGFGVAMKAGATKSDFDATIGIHPTSAEEFVTMRTAVTTTE